MIGNIIGIGLGLGLADRALQEDQNRRLMKQQMDAQKEMAQFNREEQVKLFEQTGVEAQANQIEKAGLNRGLMYKGSGAGGSTALATGNVTGATADSGTLTKAMGIGLQQEMQKATIELTKAQTEKTLAEAENTGTVERGLIQGQWDLAKQQVLNERAKTEINNLEASIKTMSERMMTDNYALIKEGMGAEAQKKYEEWKQICRSNRIGDATEQTQIDAIATELTNAQIYGEYLRAGIEVDKKTVEKLSADIVNATRGLDLEERRTIIQEKIGEFNTGLGAEIERGSRILGNTVSAVTDVLPQTKTVKKTFERFKEDKEGNKSGEYGTEIIKSK